MRHQQLEFVYKCEVSRVCHSEAMVPEINTKKRTGILKLYSRCSTLPHTGDAKHTSNHHELRHFETGE